MLNTKLNKMHVIILAIVISFLFPLFTHSAPKNRKAVLVDIKGAEFKFSVVGIEPYYTNTFLLKPYSDTFIIVTPFFEFGMPISAVVSIERTDKTWRDDSDEYSSETPIYNISYKFKDKTEIIKGSLRDFHSASNTLVGESDFGKMEIDMNKIKRIVFDELPTLDLNIRFIEKKANTYITLKDGTTTPISNLHLHNREYSTEGYIIGGDYVHHQLEYLPLFRGDMLIKVDFKKVNTIILGESEEIGVVPCTVKLNNGSSTTGELRQAFEFVGFTGFSKAGPFFVRPKKVKEIRFETQP